VTQLKEFSDTANVRQCDKIDGGYTVYVNASPVGMRESDQSPIPLDLIKPSHVIADVVAVPNETELTRATVERGATLVNGFDMVRGQIDFIAKYLVSASTEQ